MCKSQTQFHVMIRFRKCRYSPWLWLNPIKPSVEGRSGVVWWSMLQIIMILGGGISRFFPHYPTRRKKRHIYGNCDDRELNRISRDYLRHCTSTTAPRPSAQYRVPRIMTSPADAAPAHFSFAIAAHFVPSAGLVHRRVLELRGVCSLMHAPCVSSSIHSIAGWPRVSMASIIS